jgi:hypothetical protein
VCASQPSISQSSYKEDRILQDQKIRAVDHPGCEQRTQTFTWCSACKEGFSSDGHLAFEFTGVLSAVRNRRTAFYHGIGCRPTGMMPFLSTRNQAFAMRRIRPFPAIRLIKRPSCRLLEPKVRRRIASVAHFCLESAPFPKCLEAFSWAV